MDSLPYMKVGLVLQYIAPCPYELGTVALGAWAPHGGAFGAVKYAELYGGSVSDESHMAAKSIYLSDNLSFSYTSDGRIAAHLPNLVHIHGNETGLGTHLSSGSSGLATRVACTDHNNVILKVHTNYKFTANSWNGR